MGWEVARQTLSLAERLGINQAAKPDYGARIATCRQPGFEAPENRIPTTMHACSA
jgi:hypothetical protein